MFQEKNKTVVIITIVSKVSDNGVNLFEDSEIVGIFSNSAQKVTFKAKQKYGF